MQLSRILLSRNNLQSRVIRELVGSRVVNLVDEIVSIPRDNGNLLSQVFNIGKKLLGFAVTLVIKAIVWSVLDLVDVLVEAYFEVKYFDWNQTDQAIKQQLAANDVALAGSLGRLAGTGLVWLAGIGVGLGLSFKYPVLAGKVALALADEGGQEIRAALTNLIIVSRNIQIQNVLLGGLLNARSLGLFGLKPITQEKKPWSINTFIETVTERIGGPKLKAFVTQGIDSIEDSIIEMGYVIAYTLDDYYLSQRMANSTQFGQARTIELTPDVRVSEERIILEAPQELAVSTVQTTIAQHQLVHNRDMGQIVGMPESDYVRPAPQRRKLKVIFRGKKSPPWKLPDGTVAMTAEVNIPDVKRGLTWSQLKSVVKPYTWGKYQITAHLSNGRQMRCFAVSYSEGERQLNEYIKLSTATITRFHHGVAATDDPDPNKRKKPTLVYPAYAKLTVGDVRADGTLRSKKKNTVRVDLWVNDEPDNSDHLK